MALPDNLTYVTVTGSISDPSAVIIFRTPVWLIGDPVVPRFGQAAVIASDGSFSISLPATDDPAWTPVDWSYEVVIRAGGQVLGGSLAVPAGSPGGVLAFEAAFQPDQAVTTEGASYLLLGARGIPGGVAALNADGQVLDGDGNPVTEGASYDRALRSWHYALANRFYAPASVAVIGSSSSEGVGATVYGRQYVNQLRDRLREKFPVPGVAGGENYVSSWGAPNEGATPAYTWPVVRSAGTGNDNSSGWALKTTVLNSNGHTLTYTFTGTSVEIWYAIYGGGGNFSVTLDGVVVAASIATSGTSDRNAKWSSGALSAGSHTIIVTRVAGGPNPVYVHGFASYNGDESKGIRMFNGAQGSKSTVDFVNNVAQWSPRLATIQPHLVILQLGLNDWQQNVPAATIKANLKTIIATVRAGVTTKPAFVIYGSPQVTGSTYSEPFSAITEAWKAVAEEDTGGYGGTSGVTYFDLADRQVSPSIDNTPGIYQSDLLHPTDKGHSQIADALVSFLTP